MKISMLQENLKYGLATVAHAVAARSTLPVLSNVLITAKEDGITLSGTDLNTAIVCRVGGKVDEPGAVTLPLKMLAPLVLNLPNDKITLQLSERDQSVTVTCARTRATIKGIEADEFPAIPGENRDELTALAQFDPVVLRTAISQVAVATATDDSRPALAGVLIELAGAQARLIATDGFRMAKRSIPLAAQVDGVTKVLIPGRALLELGRLLADADELVTLALTPSQGQLITHLGGVRFLSRLIEGKFPDYQRIIPASCATRTVVDVAELKQAITRAALFAFQQGGTANIKLMMEPGGDLRPGRLTLSANAAEVGENIEEVDALIAGEGEQIALSPKYFLAALNTMGADQVALETQTPASPIVLKPVGGEDGEHLHLIMPMSVR